MASYRLAIRRDTAVNWTNANPVLAQGELGYEADTGRLKIGDGSTPWASLGYYTSVSGADLGDLTDVDLTTNPPTSGDILVWDGSSFVPAPNLIEKQYRYDGALALSAGTARLYVPADCSGFAVDAYLGTASTSGDVTVDVLVDGATDTTVTIPASSTTAAATSATALTEGSYVTIDITNTGTDSSDLYLTLTFTRT